MHSPAVVTHFQVNELVTDILGTSVQSPIFPGAVAYDGLIFISEVIHPSLFEPTEQVPGFRQQASVALDEVLRFVSDAGGTPDTVLKVDAYLSKTEHVAARN